MISVWIAVKPFRSTHGVARINPVAHNLAALLEQQVRRSDRELSAACNEPDTQALEAESRGGAVLGLVRCGKGV